MHLRGGPEPLDLCRARASKRSISRTRASSRPRRTSSSATRPTRAPGARRPGGAGSGGSGRRGSGNPRRGPDGSAPDELFLRQVLDPVDLDQGRLTPPSPRIRRSPPWGSTHTEFFRATAPRARSVRQARTRRLDGLVGSATISMSQAISTILGLHHLLRPNIIRCTWKQAPSNRGRPGPASPPCSATSCAWGVSRSGGRWLPSATCSETSSSGVAGPAGRRLGSPWPSPGWPRAPSRLSSSSASATSTPGCAGQPRSRWPSSCPSFS